MIRIRSNKEKQFHSALPKITHVLAIFFIFFSFHRKTFLYVLFMSSSQHRRLLFTEAIVLFQINLIKENIPKLFREIIFLGDF